MLAFKHELTQHVPDDFVGPISEPRFLRALHGALAIARLQPPGEASPAEARLAYLALFGLPYYTHAYPASEFLFDELLPSYPLAAQ